MSTCGRGKTLHRVPGRTPRLTAQPRLHRLLTNLGEGARTASGSAASLTTSSSQRCAPSNRPARRHPLRAEASILALNDQHAYMKLDVAEDLRVGDLVRCDISHPCTAFDKWRLIPVVDEGYRVLDAVLTYF